MNCSYSDVSKRSCRVNVSGHRLNFKNVDLFITILHNTAHTHTYTHILIPTHTSARHHPEHAHTHTHTHTYTHIMIPTHTPARHHPEHLKVPDHEAYRGTTTEKGGAS